MKKASHKSFHGSMFERMENSLSLRALKKGLMLTIPFLLVGSFCLVLISNPIPGFKEWIQNLAGGMVFQFLMLVYQVTMGMIVIPIVIGVSYSYASMIRSEYTGCYVMSSFLNYIIFASGKDMTFSFDIFSTLYVFTALMITLFTCFMLRKLFGLTEKFFGKNYLSGLDLELQSALSMLLPVIVIIVVILLFKFLFVNFMEIDISNFGTQMMKHLFQKLGTGLLGSTVFVLITTVMWFFGIHGDNMLSYVSYVMYEDAMRENMLLVNAGGEAVHIFTRTFFDTMLFMGGTGATLALLIAMLIGSKKKSHKKLFKFGIIPSLFNINEIVIFGLPIVFNPILIIPFVLTPLVLLYLDAFVMYVGLVPCVTQEVAWTTPIFFSGYLSTGSIRGALLQAVNLLVGVGIYIPFIRWSDRHTEGILRKGIEALTEEIMECEKSGLPIDFHYEGNISRYNIIKMLEKDLSYAIQKEEIELHYQPQIRSDDTLYGVEALLRWHHPAVGYIYPPLVIALARQENLLDKLGFLIIEKAAAALEEISKHMDEPIHMSVNISPAQFDNPKFSDEVVNMLKKYDFGKSILCFEITEQIALSMTGRTAEQIKQLKDMGIPFHMDDFGMGHSSLVYLQKNEFSVVKLDGSLVREIETNTRSLDIIRGIQEMSGSLNYVTIAEYVETREQVELLRKLGCNIFQGWYYSKAVPLEELKKYLLMNNLYVE